MEVGDGSMIGSMSGWQCSSDAAGGDIMSKGGFSGAIYATNQLGSRSSSTMPSEGRRVHFRSNYRLHIRPTFDSVHSSQQTSYACTFLPRHAHPCSAKSSMRSITTLAVLSNTFPPTESCRASQAPTWLWAHIGRAA